MSKGRKQKPKLIYDIDGFFSPANMSLDHKLVSVELEEQPLDSLFEQYYLGLRSAMFVCEDSITKKSEALEAIRIWREASAKSAMAYVYQHTNTGKVLAPDFIWITKTAIISELQNDYPEVKNIQFRVSMQPKLSARAIDKNIIIFPALARAVLNHCNLVLVNSILRDTNKDGKILCEPDIRMTARFILPYLLFCHDDISVQNLPIIGAHSVDAFNFAMRLTNLQLMFILAHENAHIHLNHFSNREINYETKMRMEKEADLFALEVVLGHGEKSNLYSKHDTFTAIRWLFKYHLLEETLGNLIRGDNSEFLESKFEKRRGAFQSELIKNKNSGGSSLFETRGFYTLAKLYALLYDSDPELIDYIINTFRKSKKTQSIEPWWEKIPNT